MKPDTRTFLEELANGEFLSPFKREPLEHAKSHIDAITVKARELLREETAPIEEPSAVSELRSQARDFKAKGDVHAEWSHHWGCGDYETLFGIDVDAILAYIDHLQGKETSA